MYLSDDYIADGDRPPEARLRVDHGAHAADRRGRLPAPACASWRTQGYDIGQGAAGATALACRKLPMKIAIIGSGIAGNVAAYRLHREHEITVYEADGHVGGHSHTHTVRAGRPQLPGRHGLHRLQRLDLPEVHRAAGRAGRAIAGHAAMSFSVRNDPKGLEYNGTTLNTLFAQRRNLLRPSFLAMVRDILRFNREAPGCCAAAIGELPLGEMLRAGRATAGPSSTTTSFRWARPSGPRIPDRCSRSRRASSCAS